MDNYIIIQTENVIDSFKPISKGDEKRLNECKRMLERQKQRWFNNKPIDQGLYGRVKEVLAHSHGSEIYKVRKQGWTDGYYRYKNVNYPYENKVNGGRIESLFDAYDNPNYLVHYTLDIIVKSKKGDTHRYLDKVYFVSDFIDILIECKAIKNTNGRNNERAIQVSSKKLYDALLKAGEDFNREKVVENLLK